MICDNAVRGIVCIQAVKHTLFMETNSAALTLETKTGFPIYKLLLIVFHIVALIYLAYITLEIVQRTVKPDLLPKKVMKIIRIVLWTVAALLLACLLFMFFTEWLPVLQFALQTAV